MFNALLNRISALVLSRKTKTYRHYPFGKTALVLIDVQSEFVEHQIGLRERLENLTKFAREQGMTIVYCPFGGKPPSYTLPPGLLGMLSKQEAVRLKLSSNLFVTSNKGKIMPERIALSAFFDGSLSEYFTNLKIEHLVFAGAYADLSIDSTARHSSELGFHTTVLADCCGATSDAAHQSTTEVTLPRMVHSVMTSEEWFVDVKKSNSES